jgi:DNA helicase IV
VFCLDKHHLALELDKVLLRLADFTACPDAREAALTLKPETDVHLAGALLRQTVDAFRAAGHKSIAVITRSQSQADSLSTKLDRVYRLDGGEADLNYETGDNVVACYHLTKGMEFDAVVVVWPEVELTQDERRRLYTAASRALHALAVLGGDGVVREMGKF